MVRQCFVRQTGLANFQVWCFKFSVSTFGVREQFTASLIEGELNARRAGQNGLLWCFGCVNIWAHHSGHTAWLRARKFIESTMTYRLWHTRRLEFPVWMQSAPAIWSERFNCDCRCSNTRVFGGQRYQVNVSVDEICNLFFKQYQIGTYGFEYRWTATI